MDFKSKDLGKLTDMKCYQFSKCMQIINNNCRIDITLFNSTHTYNVRTFYIYIYIFKDSGTSINDKKNYI